MIIDFDFETSASINCLAVNKTKVVKLTPRVFSRKMPMFAKLSLMSFTYEMFETFYFPNDKTKIIYNSYSVEKILPYHILTDSDSTFLCFIIIYAKSNSVPDDNFRGIIFDAIVQKDIVNRFDTSNTFWEKFLARDKSLEKKLGCFEIESIDNPCQVVIAVNPNILKIIQTIKNIKVYGKEKKEWSLKISHLELQPQDRLITLTHLKTNI